ncbi:MAG: molybdopterin molybdotransferase MoeA [Sulfurimonas sp.]|nr:molybdopterin molybdotransferase MoeA [Sulfurimonas sp.]
MAVTVEEALEIIYKQSKTKSIKILPLEKSLGHILAQNIVATHNLPPFDNSAMDGYAVKVCDATKTVSVEHTVFAGDKSNVILKVGHAIKIMTGAKIPEGCECVVPKEDTEATIKSPNSVILPAKLTQARHIRRMGEDINIGDTLLLCGDKLGAHQITLLASQGISHIKVYKKPRIALFASGSELKMHSQTLESHQVYNTNTPTFTARALELGCEVDFIGTAVDSLSSLKEHVRSALDSDLIITSGGVSVGDADFVKEAFASFGCNVFFDKVAIKPGKPTTLGKIANTLVLNLPGNPLAAALNFELFGQSIILALSGSRSKYINTIQAKIKKEYRLKKGRRNLVPGFFDGEYFNVCEKFAPGMVSPLGASNAYIMIHEDCEILQKESYVKIIATQFCFTSKKQVNLVTGV